MSSDPMQLSDISSASREEAEYAADYEAVYAELASTQRGRWFLREFAGRSRGAEAQALVEALARVEAAVRSDPLPEFPAALAREFSELVAAIGYIEAAVAASEAPPNGASPAAERIQDVAFMLREREIDAALCDTLEAAIGEIGNAFARSSAAAERAQSAVALLRDVSGRINFLVARALADDPAAPPAADDAAIPADAEQSEAPAERGVAARHAEESGEDEAVVGAPSAQDCEAEEREDDYFAAAIGALAASFAPAEPLDEAASPPPEAAADVVPEVSVHSSDLAAAGSAGIEPAAVAVDEAEPVAVGKSGEQVEPAATVVKELSASIEAVVDAVPAEPLAGVAAEAEWIVPAEVAHEESAAIEAIAAEPITSGPVTAEPTADPPPAYEATANEPPAQDLMAQDLMAQDLTAQDLTAQDLTAQDLTVHDLPVRGLPSDWSVALEPHAIEPAGAEMAAEPPPADEGSTAVAAEPPTRDDAAAAIETAEPAIAAHAADAFGPSSEEQLPPPGERDSRPLEEVESHPPGEEGHIGAGEPAAAAIPSELIWIATAVNGFSSSADSAAPNPADAESAAAEQPASEDRAGEALAASASTQSEEARGEDASSEDASSEELAHDVSANKEPPGAQSPKPSTGAPAILAAPPDELTHGEAPAQEPSNKAAQQPATPSVEELIERIELPPRRYVPPHDTATDDLLGPMTPAIEGDSESSHSAAEVKAIAIAQASVTDEDNVGLLFDGETADDLLPDAPTATGPEEDPADLFEPLPASAPITPPLAMAMPRAHHGNTAPPMDVASEAFSVQPNKETAPAVAATVAARPNSALETPSAIPAAAAVRQEKLPPQQPPPQQLLPPLHAARPQAARAAPRPAVNDLFAPVQALSEEELIALFS